MKKAMLGLFVLGLTIQSLAQVIDDGQLPEVIVHAVNYKYLNTVNNDDLDSDVKFLEREVATFDYRNSNFYNDEYPNYSISFYIPDGMIVAAYGDDGKIVRTIEKFKNVQPPRSVISAVAKKFPGWSITKDVYKVSYHKDKGVTQTYKLVIENGKERIHVKTDAKGKFL